MSGEGKRGVSTGSIEVSAARRLRSRLERLREETRWRRQSGPVSVRFECPLCGGPHAKADHPSEPFEAEGEETLFLDD
jgi:hypothetical protein